MTTPEARAEAIDIVREIAKESPADGLLLKNAIAAAIRAAVAAERERTAKIARDKERAMCCDIDIDPLLLGRDTAAEIAYAIEMGPTP